jgi:hypothetical protein
VKTSAALLRDVQVHVTNLSVAGCQFLTPLFLAQGTVGRLELTLEASTRTEWFRVTRVDAARDGRGGYVCGAEFLPLSLASEHTVRGAVRQIVAAPAGSLSGKTGRSARPSRAAGSATVVAARVFARKKKESIRDGA